ncbi:tolC family type I secretion outer membrane protein [Bacteroides sp. CAG:462]|nr:tolC family type I secretion outer membrane protein [Bacteroides sp. CAG:462]
MKQGIVYAIAAFAITSPWGVFAQEVKTWTLNDCIRYALEQNIQLQQNRLSLEESKVDVKTAKAALFPSLSFSTGHNMTNRPYQETSSMVSGTEIISSSNKTSYTGSYGLNAQWTVWNGGQRLNTIKQQKLNKETAELTVNEQENTLQEEITKLYVQILYADESVRINEGTLELSKAQYERGKELLAAGDISKSELAQLESQVSNDNYQLVTAQTSLENYKLQLKQLLELDGDREFTLAIPELDETNVLSPLPAKADIYNTALALRPEIQSSRLNIQSADLSISMAKAGYLPNVSLTAGIGTNHTTGSDFTFSEQVKRGWNNSIGLSVSLPIFSNRETKSAVEKAKIQRESRQLDLTNAQKELYRTIETMWLDASSAQQQFVAADAKLKSSQSSYELVNEQFKLGMKNTVELLTEKNNLMSAQQERVQAKYMAILNRVLLEFYAGNQIEI